MTPSSRRRIGYIEASQDLARSVPFRSSLQTELGENTPNILPNQDVVP